MSFGRFPFWMDDVPDKILGSHGGVVHQPAQEIVQLPGGHQAGVVNERTYTYNYVKNQDSICCPHPQAQGPVAPQPFPQPQPQPQPVPPPGGGGGGGNRYDGRIYPWPLPQDGPQAPYDMVETPEGGYTYTPDVRPYTYTPDVRAGDPVTHQIPMDGTGPNPNNRMIHGPASDGTQVRSVQQQNGHQIITTGPRILGDRSEPKPCRTSTQYAPPGSTVRPPNYTKSEACFHEQISGWNNSPQLSQGAVYAQPTADSEMIHAEQATIVDANATVDVSLFNVPQNMTAFLDKVHLKGGDSDCSSLAFLVLKDGQPMRALISNDLIRGETLVDDMRNALGQFESEDVIGIRVINQSNSARRVVVGISGWLNNLRFGERNRR